MDFMETATYAAHLYTCDQGDDPCYQLEPREGETWADYTSRRAMHVAQVVERKG